MPLHLLSKKSWNVYSPASIARVRADEAAHAAREEAQNQLELEWQASCRLATLRGLPAPLRPKELDEDVAEVEGGADAGGRQERLWEREDRKRKRRRAGEDDTERDIRVAREDLGRRGGERDGGERRRGSEKRAGRDDLPLVDAAGHIQLFAPSDAPQNSRSLAKRDRDPTQALRQQQQAEREEGSLRFSQAGANRSNPTSKPWYAGSGSGYSGTETLDEKNMLLAGESTGRDVWGNEDPGRKTRDAVRTAAADPMAVMQMAQKKLKQVEREREVWKKTREVEVGMRRGASERPVHSREGERRHRSSHRRRSRSRSPGEARSHHRHHRRRSRSPDEQRRTEHHDREGHGSASRSKANTNY